MVPAEKKTFREFDKFGGLEAFADKLTEYLLTEYRFVDGSYVLSLNSEFGSRKTTFFQMWFNKHASANNLPEVVYLNAWESDFQGDPLLAIVSKLTLPVKSLDVTERFSRALVREYFSEEAYERKSRFRYAKQDQHDTEDVVELCQAFSLNARQIHEMFRTAAHVLSSTNKASSSLLWGCHEAALFMVALSLKKDETYHRVGRKEISIEEFTRDIKSLSLWTSNRRHGFWWAALVYLGAFGNESMETLEREFKALGVWDPSGNEEKAFEREIEGVREGYGHRADVLDTVFGEIYEIIEGLKTFAER